MWFWGVTPQYEGTLKHWATKEMRLGEEHVQLVRLSDWESDAERFGRAIGRPFFDQQVLEKLRLRSATAVVREQ